MAGAIGKDPFGEACRQNLEENGVDVRAIRVTDEPTGCAFITVDGSGENAITVASGANMALRSADLPDDLLSKTSVLVLQMEVSIAENLEVAARARRAGVKVVWNFAPVPPVRERSAMAELLEVTDVLVVNEHEALAIAEIVGEPAGDDYLKAGTAIARSFGATCIVTAGSQGAFAIAPDGSRIHAAARPIVPVDTTGAGDTFVGVLANGLAEGLEIGQAMERACAAASLSCLTAGAQAGMPGREALSATSLRPERLLRDYLVRLPVGREERDQAGLQRVIEIGLAGEQGRAPARRSSVELRPPAAVARSISVRPRSPRFGGTSAS